MIIARGPAPSFRIQAWTLGDRKQKQAILPGERDLDCTVWVKSSGSLPMSNGRHCRENSTGHFH